VCQAHTPIYAARISLLWLFSVDSRIEEKLLRISFQESVGLVLFVSIGDFPSQYQEV